MTKAFLNGAAALLLFLSGCALASLPPAQSQHAASDLIQEQNLTDRFCVLQSGCIGLCKYEPVVQIEEPGKPTVTYIRMTPDKAKEVLERHLLGGQIIDQYTLDYADHQ